jgi:hypothetical protein
MSRSGYNDDCDNDWSLIRWRGQVASAIRGKRGQAFLRELLDALDAMPEKRLIAHRLQASAPAFIPPEFATPRVCALGSVGLRRGIAMDALDPEDFGAISDVFGIAHQLVQEIEWMNDEAGWNDSPETRWHRVRDWCAENVKASPQ